MIKHILTSSMAVILTVFAASAFAVISVPDKNCSVNLIVSDKGGADYNQVSFNVIEQKSGGFHSITIPMGQSGRIDSLSCSGDYKVTANESKVEKPIITMSAALGQTRERCVAVITLKGSGSNATLTYPSDQFKNCSGHSSSSGSE